MLDIGTEQGRAVERRLREEEIIWLTTVRRDGQPQSVPVWFVWDGATFLIYSRPRNQKLRNIRANPRVALNLNSDSTGNAVVRVEGTAEIVAGGPLASDVPALVEKYREAIPRIGMDPAGFARAYSVAIRVHPNRFRVE
jgi:PPOX class probable F420-dependent enzyme